MKRAQLSATLCFRRLLELAENVRRPWRPVVRRNLYHDDDGERRNADDMSEHNYRLENVTLQQTITWNSSPQNIHEASLT